MAIIFVTVLLRLIWEKFWNPIGRRYTIDEKLCTFARQSATDLPHLPPLADRLASYIIVTGTKDTGVGKTVFVPLTDDLLYEHPERILGPVIPFSQQARRTVIEPTGFSSPTLGRNTEMRLETAISSPASRSKRGNISLPQGLGVSLGQRTVLHVRPDANSGGDRQIRQKSHG